MTTYSSRVRTTLSGLVTLLFLLHLTIVPDALYGQSVVISEFVASNSGGLADEDGDYSDWIELHNGTSESVDLDGWSLTDDGGNLRKWTLPSVVLPPDTYLLVFASGKDRRTLGNAWDTVVRAQDAWRYRASVPPPAGWQEPAFDDSGWSTGAAPIGFGEPNLNTTVPTGTQGLFLRTTFNVTDPTQVLRGFLHISYDDGFVAYLNGAEIGSANCCSAPSAVEPGPLQSISLSTIASLLQTGENLLAIEVRNSGTNSTDLYAAPYLTLEFATPPANPRGVANEVRPLPEANLHTNFSLSKDGEYLALVDPQGRPVSAFNPFPPQLSGISYGISDGVLGYFNTPTPGAANVAAAQEMLQPPTFSMKHGFFDAPFSLLMFPETPGSTIRYTTDGTEPTAILGQIYTGPITIDRTSVIRAVATAPGAITSPSVTATYIFPNDVIRQSPTGTPPAGWPSRWGNNATDYGMDPQVVNGKEADVIESLLSIPSFSLVTNRDHLFHPQTGIYSNALGYGREWERPASVELIRPDGGEGFQINAGVRIRGGWSRNNDNPKHAFRFYFRNDYGVAKLVYPLFEDEGVDEFDVIDLRTSQNYSWSKDGDSRNTMVREVWSRDTQKAMGDPYTRSRYYHLYVNGQYWGLYQTQERAEASYGESYFGGNKEDYDVIKSAGLGGNYQIEATDGDFTAWRALWEGANQIPLLSTEEARTAQYMRLQGLNPDGTRNPAYEVLLDVDNLINYMLVIFYTGNFDAPLSGFRGNSETNNFFSMRRRGGDQGFVHFAHDNEHTLLPEDNRYTNRTGPYPGGSLFEYSNPQWIHQQLMASGEYRLRFADRAHEHLFNDGALTTQKALERLDERAAQVAPALLAESARWGDSRSSQPFGLSHWQNEVNRLRNSIFPPRNAQIVSQLRATTRYIDGNPSRGTTSAPLYPSVVAPNFNSNGGEVAANFGLQISAPAGEIYYTLDGSDPRLIGGGVSPAASAYTGTITLEQTTTVKARARTDAGWSALMEASFRPGSVGPTKSRLTITEINYHPADATAEELASGVGDNEDFEFIEILNTADAPVDLEGIRFTDGITYTFGSMMLEPGERVVLAGVPDALAVRYGAIDNVVGPYQGNLSNAGERLTLTAPDGSVLASLEFDDAHPWPARADGVGSTLELVSLDADVADPRSWRASFDYLGSPGSAGSSGGPGIVFNEVMPNAEDPLVDAIELHNPGDTDADISGWLLSDSRDFTGFRLPAGTVVPAGGYLVLEEGDFNPPDDSTGFTLNATRGESLWLIETNTTGRLLRFSDEAFVPAARVDESYGRLPDGTGNFFPMQQRTFGATNGSPRVGPVVIREFMYEPPGNNENLEYIELYNAGTETEDLWHWSIADGVDFSFPSALPLAPGSSVVVVGFNPNLEPEKGLAFREAYWHLRHVPLVGPWTGRLDNEGESIVLYRAEDPSPSNPSFYPQVIEDRVTYASIEPWPTDAAGQGAALRRVEPLAFPDDPASWTGAIRPVDAEEGPQLPEREFALLPPYPNPVTESATIVLQLRDPQHVRLEVYDVLGRRVMQLHNGMLDGARDHRFEIRTAALASGLYLVRAIGERLEDTKSVTIVR